MSIVVHETSRAILLLTAYKPGGKFGALQIDLSTDKVLSFSEKYSLYSGHSCYHDETTLIIHFTDSIVSTHYMILDLSSFRLYLCVEFKNRQR